VTLVGPDFATLLSANTNMTSTAVYNPANILAAAAAKPAGVTVWTHTVISYAELLAQKCKLYRGRSSDLDPAYKGGHPFEYKVNGCTTVVTQPLVSGLLTLCYFHRTVCIIVCHRLSAMPLAVI
jgi:hypothetical protein